jgi:hypothetical protein
VSAKVPPAPPALAAPREEHIREDDSDRKSATSWKCRPASAEPLKVDYVVGKSLMGQLELDKPSIRALYQAETSGMQ